MFHWDFQDFGGLKISVAERQRALWEAGKTEFDDWFSVYPALHFNNILP